MNFGFSERVFRFPRRKRKPLAAKKHKNTKNQPERVIYSAGLNARNSDTDASRLFSQLVSRSPPVFQPKYGNTFEVEPWCKE
jgi:hypothetical protein